MAAFSRGFFGLPRLQSLRLPCSIRLSLNTARAHPINTKFFSSTCIRSNRYYQRARSMDPVLRKVEATMKPVLLYQAPNRKLYTIGVYAFGSGLIATGLGTLNWRYELPLDLPFFVGPTYTVLSFLFMALGIYVFTAPLNRCKSIEVMRSAYGQLQFRVMTNRIPFTKPKEIIAEIGEPVISEKLNPVVRELKEAQRARQASVSEGLEGVFIIPRMWEIMARGTEQKWTSFFLRFKFMVLRFGNVDLEFQGSKWKIDCTGYLLEDGKAIDRIIDTV